MQSPSVEHNPRKITEAGGAPSPNMLHEPVSSPFFLVIFYEDRYFENNEGDSIGSCKEPFASFNGVIRIIPIF